MFLRDKSVGASTKVIEKKAAEVTHAGKPEIVQASLRTTLDTSVASLTRLKTLQDGCHHFKKLPAAFGCSEDLSGYIVPGYRSIHSTSAINVCIYKL